MANNKTHDNSIEFASRIVYERLNTPKHYLAYGPYWWALKDVLARQGYDMGGEMDDEMLEAYRASDDAQTLVAADMFYEDMSNKVLKDNNRWDLGRGYEEYVVFDEDWE